MHKVVEYESWRQPSLSRGLESKCLPILTSRSAVEHLLWMWSYHLKMKTLSEFTFYWLFYSRFNWLSMVKLILTLLTLVVLILWSINEFLISNVADIQRTMV